MLRNPRPSKRLSSRMAPISEPVSRCAARTSSMERPRCSESSCMRKVSIAPPTAPSPSKARSHSVSNPIERALMLLDPIRRTLSSAMRILAWT